MTVERSSPLFHSKPRTGKEIRSAFLQFFSERQHKIIPSASLVPDDPTVLLTIAGMLPFKPVFLGNKERPAARAASSQKCIRTNDIENVGRTARHHTFFEMLGNFSFGDYFKEDAIKWAWELSTEVYGLDPKNLVVSVFRDDDEAYNIWRDAVGVNSQRIIRMDEEDNFWTSGPTGPCGPCSELYFDFQPELGNQEIDLNDDNRFIEFYNLVFMQYNKNSEGELTPLENCNIDTGMGLERMAQILQGVPNNYETDLIYPLLIKAASFSGIDYKKASEKVQTSLKVIADHSRAVIQLISDGVAASNLGRGYVLRRLLRRVIRHGRLIGINQPFLVNLGDAAIQLMYSTYPELDDRREVILNELQREETRFLETLERGEKLLADILKNKPNQITGQQAFELYDTYGFPLELTEEIAEEHNLGVDVKAFEKEMDAQRQRAKSANISLDLTIKDVVEQISNRLDPTIFEGYLKLEEQSVVKALVVNGQSSSKGSSGDKVEIILDKTTFYGEGGGQVGDCGVLFSNNLEHDKSYVHIDSVRRSNGVFVHSGSVQRGTLEVGDDVITRVDNVSRRKAQANHTATHLLQAALKKIVDPNISQAGSLVNFDRLRFDFNLSRALTLGELDQIEDLINSWILEAHILQVKNMTIQEAKKIGALAMFGEKYGEVVRVVDVPGVSMELCGGTHVANTAEIGVFKIVAEIGIAAGIRRIEAIAGPAVLHYLNKRDEVVKQLMTCLKIQPIEIVERVLAMQNEIKTSHKMLRSTLQELAILKASAYANEVKVIGKSQFIVKRFDGVEGGAMQASALSLLEQLGDNSAVIFGGIPDSQNFNKVIFVAAFGKNVISYGLKAGHFIGSIAKHCGGGGGGRANLAQAGGRDGSKLDFSLEMATENLIKAFS